MQSVDIKKRFNLNIKGPILFFGVTIYMINGGYVCGALDTVELGPGGAGHKLSKVVRVACGLNHSRQ